MISLGDDWVTDCFKVLLLLFIVVLVSVWVGRKPVLGFLDGGLDLFLVVLIHLVSEFFWVLDGVLHLVDVGIEGVSGVDLLLGELVLFGELLSVSQHLFDFLLGESSLIIGDGDLVLDSGSLVNGGDLEDTVGVDFEGDLNLGDSSWGGGDISKIEFSQQMVVLGHWSFSFEDLDGDSGLLVLIGGENLRLLGGDERTSWDNGGHNSSDGFDSQTQWGGINDNQTTNIIRFFSTDNSSLDGGSESDGFIWINSSVWVLSVEEVLNELSDLGNTGGSSNQDDFVDFVLLQTGVIKSALDWGQSLLEEISVQFLELGSSQNFININSLNEVFDFDLGFMGG